MLGIPSIQQSNPAGNATPTSAIQDILAAPATLATIQGLLQSGDTGGTAAAQSITLVTSLGQDVSALAQAFPANTSLSTIATTAKTQADAIATLLANVTPANTPILGTSATVLSSALAAGVLTAQKTAAVYWGSVLASAVTTNGCPVQTGLANYFQVAYNAAHYSQVVPTTDVYDAATQAALNEVMPGQAPSCPAVSTTGPGLQPLPGQPPVVVVNNPPPAVKASSTGVLVGTVAVAAAVGMIGWLVYTKAAGTTTAAMAKKNPLQDWIVIAGYKSIDPHGDPQMDRILRRASGLPANSEYSFLTNRRELVWSVPSATRARDLAYVLKAAGGPHVKTQVLPPRRS